MPVPTLPYDPAESYQEDDTRRNNRLCHGGEFTAFQCQTQIQRAIEQLA